MGGLNTKLGQMIERRKKYGTTSEGYTGINPNSLPSQGDYGQSGSGGSAKRKPRQGRGNMGPVQSPLST